MIDTTEGSHGRSHSKVGAPPIDNQDAWCGQHQVNPSQLKHLYRTFKDLCEDVQKSKNSSSEEFRLATANAQYSFSEVAKELQRLTEIGDVTQADGKSGSEILDELQTFQQQLSGWQHQNNFYNILNNQLDLPAPGLFLVLPADIDFWDDSDPSTHTFRLYFICDFGHDEPLQSNLPHFKHLSDHPGYDVVRTKEFFQEYGSYALSILNMVKHGYSSSSHEVPPLNTYNILWNCDPTTVGDIFEDNIELLVNKTITYIQKLSPKSAPGALDRHLSARIKQFLQVPYGDDGVGDLCRTTHQLLNVYWACQEHSQQWTYSRSLEELKDFVRDHGGLINMRKATLEIELVSASMAMNFCTLVQDTGHAFNISIKLGWKNSTRQELEELFLQVTSANTMHLQIEGLNLDTHPQNQIDYGVDLFADRIIQANMPQSVTLLSYPRKQEQTIYMDASGECVYQLTTERPEMRPDDYWWKNVRNELREFEDATMDMERQSCSEAAEALKIILSERGLESVSSFRIHYGGVDSWRSVFDLDKGTFSELQLRDSVFTNDHEICVASGTLSQLTVDYVAQDFDRQLARIVHCNPMLQELNVSVLEWNALSRMEDIIRTLDNHPCPLCLTLLERGANSHGRIVAQIAIQDFPCRLSEESIHGYEEIQYQNQEPVVSMSTGFLQWNCDYFYARLSDSTALWLDIATRHSPSVISSLALDLSNLSPKGLTSFENILQRSHFERLHLCCSVFDSSLTESVLRVLCSVQWPTIKFLELVGDDIDSWVHVLSKSVDEETIDTLDNVPYLLSLEIRALGPFPQELSHLSVVFLHRLIYSNPLLELCLENVEVLDEYDWRLLAEGHSKA